MAPSTNTLTFSWTGDATGFEDCNPAGSLVTITDAFGNVYSTRIPIATIIPGVYVLNLTATGLNLSTDLTVHIDACFRKISDGSTCERCIDYVVPNSAKCPQVQIRTGSIAGGSTGADQDVAITYSFVSVLSPVTYNISLYDGVTLVSSTTLVDPAPGIVTGDFLGLEPSTVYSLVIGIYVDDRLLKTCHSGTITTADFICKRATTVEAFPIIS